MSQIMHCATGVGNVSVHASYHQNYESAMFNMPERAISIYSLNLSVEGQHGIEQDLGTDGSVTTSVKPKASCSTHISSGVEYSDG
jgi:hypothetical protein